MPHSSANTSNKPSRRAELTAFIGFTFVLITVLLMFASPHLSRSAEALYRTEVARDLLRGSSRGRQGLVGSLKMSPLPTIIISLLSAALYVTPARWISCFLAAAFTLVLCLYTNRTWTRAGISSSLRYPAITALLCLPPVVMTISEGQTTMLFVGCVVAGMGFLLHWLERFDLRDLAYSALLLGGSVAVRYQGVYVVLAALLIILCATTMRKTRGMLEGTTVTFVTPAIYIALLWIGGNWLILGDPIFFIYGLASSLTIGTSGFWNFIGASCQWSVLGCVAFLVLSVPLAKVAFRAPRGGAVVHGAAFVGVTIAVILGSSVIRTVDNITPDHRIGRIVPKLEAKYPNGSFIITGYEGYEFKRVAGADPERAWIHMMHLEDSKLQSILTDFQGRRIFLLVNTTASIDKWQRLGLEWQSSRSRIPDRFLYAGKEHAWVVFEVLRETT